MKTKVALSIIGAALISLPAAAQTTRPADQAPKTMQQPAAAQSSLYEMKAGQWRATKLTGLAVYNTANERIGDISELIVDRSGKGQEIDTGVAPVFSPSGRLFAAADVGEAGFGALNAFAVWRIDPASVRQVGGDEEIPSATDWRIESWSGEACIDLSAIPWEGYTGDSTTPRQRFRARETGGWRLEPGRCEASIRHRRKVTNHIGTVHAIALCNLAELVAGVMTDASLPGSMRWIPRGMTVEYLKKANGPMHAVATPDVPLVEASEGYELQVGVVVRDRDGAAVFRARIAMWVSPRPARA